MIAAEKNQEQVSGKLDIQNDFLEILPEIRRQALFAFRALRTESKEEAVAETIANALVAFNQLMEQGKGGRYMLQH